MFLACLCLSVLFGSDSRIDDLYDGYKSEYIECPPPNALCSNQKCDFSFTWQEENYWNGSGYSERRVPLFSYACNKRTGAWGVSTTLSRQSCEPQYNFEAGVTEGYKARVAVEEWICFYEGACSDSCTVTSVDREEGGVVWQIKDAAGNWVDNPGDDRIFPKVAVCKGTNIETIFTSNKIFNCTGASGKCIEKVESTEMP